MSKFDDKYSAIITEAALPEQNVRFKAHGFYQIVNDNFEEGETDTISTGHFDDVLDKTLPDLIKRFTENTGIQLKSDEFEFTDANGSTEIQGGFICDDNGNPYTPTESEKAEFEAGTRDNLVYNYQITITKVVYVNLSKAEQQEVVDICK